MSLEYILSPNQWFSATITQFPNHQYVKDFVGLIHSDQQASLMCSNFYGFIYGSIYRAEEQFSSKLVHEFIMRLVNCGKNNEVWVRYDNHLARFGMQEFCLITGLPCHEVAIDLDVNNHRLRNQYFNGTKRINMIMLFEAFHMCEDQEDKFKLGLVMLVECILKPNGRFIDYRTLSMVEQLDHFLAYPWGRKAYFVLLNSLQESQLERVQRMQQNEQKDCKYSLHGYPLAFQYWIYEAFPQIGKKFGRRRYKTLQSPRMYKWKPKRILIEKVVKQFFSTEHIQVVVPVLQPTEEVETMWYINLSLPMDNQHNILDGIVNGQLENVLPDTFANISGTGVVAGDGVGSSSASVGSSYVTKEIMEEMLNMFRQHVVSDVSDLFDNSKAQIVEELKKQAAQHHQAILDNQQAQYQAILENQRQFFQQQQQWQEQHYQDMQSSMQSYVDKILTSIKSYIEEQNKNVLNKLSDCESKMEAIITSTQVQPKHPLNISTLRRR